MLSVTSCFSTSFVFVYSITWSILFQPNETKFEKKKIQNIIVTVLFLSKLGHSSKHLHILNIFFSQHFARYLRYSQFLFHLCILIIINHYQSCKYFQLFLDIIVKFIEIFMKFTILAHDCFTQ